MRCEPLAVVLLLTSLTISEPRHAHVSHLLISGPTFWLVWAVLGWHPRIVAGGRAGLPASSSPVVHVHCASCWCRTFVRFGKYESLGHRCGAMWVGKQLASPNHLGVWGQPFRDAGRERNVCAGICALLFAVRTRPRLPVTSTVAPTVTVLWYHGAAQGCPGVLGTCAHPATIAPLEVAPSFVSALLPNLKTTIIVSKRSAESRVQPSLQRMQAAETR